MKLKALLLTPLLALVFSLFPVGHAAASYNDYVIVENHTYGTTWPVWQAVSFVDGYTRSKMVNGTCRINYRCIRIYESHLSVKTWAGFATPRWWWPTEGPWIGQVEVSYEKRNMPYETKYRILVHEIGHNFMLLHSNDGSVMSSSTTAMRYVGFNAADSAILATQ